MRFVIWFCGGKAAFFSVAYVVVGELAESRGEVSLVSQSAVMSSLVLNCLLDGGEVKARKQKLLRSKEAIHE